MDLLLTGKSIFVICFGIYIGVWVLLVLRFFRYTRRKVEHVDVYKMKRLHKKAMLHRYFGWIWVLPLGIFITGMLPNVEIVRHDPERRSPVIWMEEDRIEGSVLDLFGKEKEYFIERYYVLFNYRGQLCKAFHSYVFNDTDSLMAIYQATARDGYLNSIDNPSEFTSVKPGEMIMIPHGNSSFYFKFESPWNSYGTQSGLAINLYGKALWDREYGQKKIEERREKFFRVLRYRGGTESRHFPYEVLLDSEENQRFIDSLALRALRNMEGMKEFKSYGE